ncbi:PAAR motif-containing protein [Paraburkholderia sp. RAU2J]|uniref:PAAR domain-containing protein n=1 Tax=Paraburkholderia sp. RAU2J TaxID=1938810 RepID=UPI000EB2CD1B|nr:PAAR domain-containing protein [Paraburkholderia sp. RAU2J]RKT26397.1 PAAR motif-containing protein [Paraburkholderia sp. RAU2J]
MPNSGRSEFLFATVGSLSERGGRITCVSTSATIDDKGLAVVGDIVTYQDGTEATIIDGAGFAAMWSNKPFALVGSRLSNGDRIISAPQDSFGITVRDGEDIPGLFDPLYVPPEQIDDRCGEDRRA